MSAGAGVHALPHPAVCEAGRERGRRGGGMGGEASRGLQRCVYAAACWLHTAVDDVRVCMHHNFDMQQ